VSGARCEHPDGRWALKDARGIFCCYVCDKCESARRSEFRLDIFEDASYEADDLGDDE
jgi:hypothetical protein